MATMEILKFPDPRLHLRGETVERFDEPLRELVDDMFETMYASEGCGLAAVQVNVQYSLFIMDTSEDRSRPLVFINPVITILDPEPSELPEGCLSVPGVSDHIGRPCRVRVDAQDCNGEHFSHECTGLEAVCVQHEYDHLEGVLFVEHLSTFKQRRLRKKVEKAERLVSIGSTVSHK